MDGHNYVKGATVLTAIEYADSASELKTEGRKIQFDLTPQPSLRLAKALIETTNHVLEESPKMK